MRKNIKFLKFSRKSEGKLVWGFSCLTSNCSTLSLIENGTQESNQDMLIALSKAMRMELSELIAIGVKKYIIVDNRLI